MNIQLHTWQGLFFTVHIRPSINRKDNSMMPDLTKKLAEGPNKKINKKKVCIRCTSWLNTGYIILGEFFYISSPCGVFNPAGPYYTPFPNPAG